MTIMMAYTMTTRLLQQYILQPWQALRTKLAKNMSGGKNLVDKPPHNGQVLSQDVTAQATLETIQSWPSETGAEPGDSKISLKPDQSKEIQEELDAAKALARLLAENTTDMISRQTPNQVYLYVSPACRTLLGYEPDELVGLSAVHLCHPREVVLLEESASVAQRSPGTDTIDHRIRRKDSRYIWVETTRKRRYDIQTGELQEIIAVSRNISERKRVEGEIEKRGRELMALQSAGIAITSRLDLRYVLDTVTREMANLLTVESCTIAEWSQAGNTLKRVARYSSGRWWDPTVLPQVQDLDQYPFTKSVLEDQVPAQMIVSQATVDPTEKAYMQQANIKSRLILPMIFQRNVVGLVELEDSHQERSFTYQEISLVGWLANQAASAIENARLYQQAQQEISERQRAEEALAAERALLAQRVEERTADLSRANAELSRAARLKDEFLANVSHELRTPLSTVLGSSEILQAGTFGPVNERQLKYLRNIEESGRHLLSLINDILDLSKAEVGKLELTIRPVAIEAVCEASLQLIRQLALKKNLKIARNFQNLVVPTVQADELRLKQILVNLLSNAVKFTPEGGQIGLEVIGDLAHQVVHFTVWDTGIGIAKEDMKNLFQPFVQIESSLSRQYTGTGLGLSLVARMAELHGGGVSLASEVGQGSRFTVSLPWSAVTKDNKLMVQNESALSQELSQRASPHQRDKPPLILMAEDNEDNINTIADYLKAQGYRLIVTRNGAEAIDRASEQRPDIILMDVQMPGMNGLEATRRLRLDPRLAEIPVIALTALAMPGDRERCLEAGATGYLSKPLHLQGLVQTIEAFLTPNSVDREVTT